MNFELNLECTAEFRAGENLWQDSTKESLWLDFHFNDRSAPQTVNQGQIQTHPKAVIVNLTTTPLQFFFLFV